MHNAFVGHGICVQKANSRTTVGYEVHGAGRCTQKAFLWLGLGFVHRQRATPVREEMQWQLIC